MTLSSRQSRWSHAAEAIRWANVYFETWIPETQSFASEVMKKEQCRRFARSLDVKIQDALIVAYVMEDPKTILDIVRQVRGE